MKKHIIVGMAVLVAAGVVTVLQPPLQGQRSRSGFNIVEATIEDIQSAYKARTVTVHQVVQMYLDRIQAYDQQGPKLNTIITLNPKALEEADKLDAAMKASGFVGPL